MPAHSHRPVVTPPNRNDSPSTTDPIVHGITTRVASTAIWSRLSRASTASASAAKKTPMTNSGMMTTFASYSDATPASLKTMHTPSIRDNAASSSVANLRGYPVAREAMNDSCSSASTSCASKLTVVVNAGNGMSNVI